MTIQKVAPENPLVVGQDPEKRGADIQASVTIPPVIFTWYEQIQDPPTCESSNSGNGGGCPGPGSRYDNHWDPSMEGNPAYEVVDGEIHCIEHVEILPEPITEVQANAQLSPESRYWILNDLASKYYEAYIHQARFDLLPGMAPVNAGCSGNGTCTAEAQVLNVPFADPGTFDLRLWAQTAGTVFNWNGVAIPITQPRVLFISGCHAGLRDPGDLTAGRRAMNELDRIGMLLDGSAGLPGERRPGHHLLAGGKLSRVDQLALCDPDGLAARRRNPAASRVSPTPQRSQSDQQWINQPSATHCTNHDGSGVYHLADRPMGYGRAGALDWRSHVGGRPVSCPGACPPSASTCSGMSKPGSPFMPWQ